jgi:hypothetical protein
LMVAGLFVVSVWQPVAVSAHRHRRIRSGR